MKVILRIFLTLAQSSVIRLAGESNLDSGKPNNIRLHFF